MNEKKPLQIAIDGPVAAGKGDIAARLAQEFGFVYIYTGAMYRALSLACIRNGISTKDSGAVLALLNTQNIDLVPPDRNGKRPYKVILNKEEVTEELFSPDISNGASDVGTIPEVRHVMVALQQKIAAGKSVVMEGRDIGLRVLPDAQLKIFLTASLDERARRRTEQLKVDKGIIKSFEEIREDTKQRDIQDTTRSTDPLQQMPDAWELDTTDMMQDQVVEAIKTELTRRNLL